MQNLAQAARLRLLLAPRRVKATTRVHQYRQAATASQTSVAPRLILYSKDECHLCHGLKEKIDGVLAKAKYLPSPLSHADLETRDITTNKDWEREYGMVIPVLTVVLPNSEEEIKVKRVPPRSSADRVAQHILEAMGAQDS